MSWNAQGNSWSQQGGNSWSQSGNNQDWQQGGQQASGNAGWGQQQQQQQSPAQGGQQQWGASAQKGNGWGQQQQQASAGPAKSLTVQGCQHPTIGGIVRGAFSAVSENHTKPVYKKDTQVSGLDVMIYYWDERDGPSQAGWWFGPKVGGEQVWAYHPDTKTAGPPKEGWQVPYGGPVDASFIVDPVQQQQQQWGQQQQTQSQQAQQGWGGQQSQQASQGNQQSWGNQQSQGNQQSWGNQQSQGNQQSWGNQSQGKEQQSWGNQSQGKDQQSWGNQTQGNQQSWGNQAQGNQQSQGKEQSWGNSQQSQGKQQSWGNQQSQGNQQWGGQQSQQQSQSAQGWGNQQQGNQQSQGWNAQSNQQQGGQTAQSWQANQQAELQKQKEAAQQQRQIQAEAFRKQQEAKAAEAKAKAEAQAQKMAEWKKKIEEEKAKKLEEENKKKEELRLKREADEKKRLEQRATFAIRRVIQRIRVATPETFDTLEGELHAELDKELQNCGEQADAMKEESEKGLEQGRARIEQIRETRRVEEEKKAKIEAEKKEKEEKAKGLAEELDGLMTTAEDQMKALQETIKSSDIESSEMTPEQVQKVSKVTDEAEESARSAIKTCFEFMKANGPAIKAPEANAETKLFMSKVLGRLNEVQKSLEAASGQAKAAKAKAEKKASAQAKTKEIENVLKKHDKDKDGVLSEKEVIAYAKAEFGVSLSKDLVSFAMMSLVEPDAKGIKASALPRLRSIVGISRELARDKKRLEFRLEKEKVIGGMKDALKSKVKNAASFVTDADKAVKEAESEIASIAKRAKVMPPDEMITLATKSDKVHDAAKAKYQKAPNELEKAMKSIDPKYEKDLKAFIHKEAAKLESDLKRMEMRLNRVSVKSRRYRDQALNKELNDLLALRAKAAKVIQYNQSVKKLSYDDLFSLFDNGSGSIGESEFLAFFETAEMDIRHLTMGEAKTEEAKPEEAEKTEKTNGDEEKAAEGEEKTEDGKEKENGTDKTEEVEEKKEEEEKEEKKVEDELLIETVELSKEELQRVFGFLSDGATSSISKDDFLPFVKRYMKVVKETAMTENAEIGTGKPARKLEIGEVVEIIEGPIKDLATKVSRVRCKALKDDLEGWLSVAGNQGTVFLEEKVGGLYKVVKKSFLTDSFELNGEADSDPSKILKAGSVLEVREEPKKEETSGLTRMKGRLRSQEHRVGWVTTVDKEGKVFVKAY